MTKLQVKELEILKQFLKICEQCGLTYFMVCGSALGAVKYGGFIPWDDDIDVALPRKDYEAFCKKAPSLLPDWCFLQNYHTDKQYYRLGSKLRDSRTTYMERMTEDLDINQGVFIDVFPLDGQWSTRQEQKVFQKKLKKFEAKRRVRLKYNRLSGRNLLMGRTNLYYILFRLFGYGGNTARTVEEFDYYVSSFSTEESEIWCNHANSASSVEYAPREQYGKGAWFTFEGLQVRVPEQYDAYLTQKYGDWKRELPEEEKIGHHFYTICDLEHPYTDYVR